MSARNVSFLLLMLVLPLACGGESSTDSQSESPGSGGSSGTENTGGSAGTGAASGSGGNAGSNVAGAGGDSGSSGSGGGGEDATGCVETGGTITTMTCCSGSSAGDGNYPSTCFTGGCGCAPEHSTEVAACDCPVGKCFDSDVNKCVDEHEEF